MKRTVRFLATALSAAALICAVAFPAAAQDKYLGDYSSSGSGAMFDSSSQLIAKLPIPNDKASNTVTSDHFLYYNGNLLELVGAIKGSESSHQAVANGKTSIMFDPITDWDETTGSWKYAVYFAYQEHVHTIPSYMPWTTDHNHHWKYCPECGGIAYINWHHDVDNDGKCDQCGDPIFYRYVKVKDAPGGKVEISKEKCMLGNRISVVVKPDAGYELQEIHGINHNDLMSVRPCYEDIKGSQYHMIVDVWDVDIYPTFVKK